MYPEYIEDMGGGTDIQMYMKFHESVELSWSSQIIAGSSSRVFRMSQEESHMVVGSIDMVN